MMGRFGNQMFQYAHARAVCEANGDTLVTEPWVGEKIFQIDGVRGGFDGQLAENYRQNQESINYTRSMVRKWFTLRPEITEKLGHLKGGVLCHQRLGDYAGLGFTVVSP